MPADDGCSVGMKDLIKQLLQKDVKSRLGSKNDWREVLSHSVFDESDVQAIQHNEYYQGDFAIDDLIIEWQEQNGNLKTDESWPVEDADSGVSLSNE